MKVRTDYVSNSSSSSFVLVGKVFGGEKLLEMLEDKYKVEKPTLLEELADEDDRYKLFELLEAYLSGTSLRQEVEDHDNGVEDISVCIGVDPNEMKGNETLNEFKEKIAEKITKAGLSCKKSEVEFVCGGSDASGFSWFGDCG